MPIGVVDGGGGTPTGNAVNTQDGGVTLAPDSTGQTTDCSAVTRGRDQSVVLRQRLVLSDPFEECAHTAVLKTNPDSTTYGAVTREVSAAKIVTLLQALLDEFREFKDWLRSK